jgi:hypothetical protein
VSLASSAFRAILLAAALTSCVAATRAALPPLPARAEERLLLDRDFETLEGALRNRQPPPSTALRLFLLAVTKLDAEAFLRLIFPRPGGGSSVGTALAMLPPAHRVNPLENPELDREARFYLLSKGLRPQGDALLHAVLDAPTDLALVDLMLKAGADLKATRPNGTTILHALVSAPLMTKAPCRPSPLRDTQVSCPTETVEERAAVMALLVVRGADPAQPDKNGTSALDAAHKLPDEQRRHAYVSALSPKP